MHIQSALGTKGETPCATKRAGATSKEDLEDQIDVFPIEGGRMVFQGEEASCVDAWRGTREGCAWGLMNSASRREDEWWEMLHHGGGSLMFMEEGGGGSSKILSRKVTPQVYL